MKNRTASNTLTASFLGLFAFVALFYIDKPSAVASDGERFELGADIEHPFGEKTVKGAPFSAQVIIESSQTLANGTHLSHKLAGALYRDSEGRTRQEFPRDGAPEIVQINDRVSGVLLNLHMSQHTLEKISLDETRANREIEERQHRHAVEEREQAEKARSVNIEAAHIEPQRKVESLGVQMFEGVQAEVKRFTLTIPAGMEGNDQPFEIVSERWYSPELQIMVMAKRSDPRSGELVYRLANISRGEQSRSLFDAPADFTVRQEKREFIRKEN